MTVRIKDKEYDFSFDSIWGPIYTYEEIAGKKLPFDPQKTICRHILFYCILLRCNKDFTLPLDDFMKALDNLSLLRQMADYYNSRMEVLTASDEDKVDHEDGGDKKKD